MKADMQKMMEVQQLTSEIDALNQSLSRPDLPPRERSALSGRQLQLQERLKKIEGSSLTSKDSLEPAYFGNARRAWGDNLVLAPAPMDGEWLPKSAVYALVDLMVVILGRPKGLFKECVKRIQSGMQIIQGYYFNLGQIFLFCLLSGYHRLMFVVLLTFLEFKYTLQLCSLTYADT